MNAIRRIQPARLLVAALTLIGVGILTLALRDIVREAVVIPLAYAAWMADLVLKSLPQGVFLAVLVITGLFIVLRGFSQAGARPAAPPFRPVADTFRSRLGFWARQFNHLDISPFAREQAAQEMRNLVLRTLAHVHQIEPGEAIRRVRSGSLSVPVEIAQLLFDWQGWMEDAQHGTTRPSPTLWRRLRDALIPTRRLSRRLSDRTARFNGKIEAVIDYVEAQLGDST